MEEAKTRNILIDVARVVCSVLVICIHTKPWLDTNFYLGYFLSDVLARLAVPLFFMFAGYFLYKRLRYEVHPEAYFKKYLKNLIRVYLVWSLIYLPFDIYMLLKMGKTWQGACLSYLHSLFIEGGHYHLWYFPALIYSVSIVYVFFIKGKIRMLRLPAVILFVIGLIAESYGGWFMGISAYAKVTYIVNILGTSRSALFFGLPFVMLGICQHEYVIRLKKKTLVYGAFVTLSLMTLESLFLHWRWNGEGYNLFVFLPLTAIMIFTIIIKTPVNLPHMNFMDSKYLRDISLLIYCFHMWPLIFIDKFLPDSFSNFYHFAICAFSTIILSLLILRSDKLRKILV